LPSGLNASETKWCISQLDWFCGTRMHATIAALSSGVPAAALAYSIKTKGVFDSCGMADSVVDAREVGSDDAVELLLSSAMRRDSTRDSLRVDVAPVVRRASRQFDEILGVVERRATS
jgi:polysaccharide pyruvyl transferase WcaK-like protein